MADEQREVTITIRAKNLTKSEFDAARKELAGVSAETGKATTATSALGQAWKQFGPAFGAAAIGAAAMKVLDYAGKINDLAAQTGLSTRAIQEMSHAAKMTGTSLDAFTNAAFKLGTNLAGGSDSVHAALVKLGLSYEELRKQSPDRQFDTIATALGGVQNAQERNKLAVELFGKAAKEILPAIAQGYDEIAKAALVAGDDQLRALDMAGDALDTFYEGAMSAGVQVLGGLVITGKEILRIYEDWTGHTRRLQAAQEGLAVVLEAAGLKSQTLPKVLNETKVAAGLLPAPLRAVSMSLEEQDRITKALDEKIKASIETNKGLATQHKKNAEAAKEFANSIQRLDTAEFFVGFKKAVESEINRPLQELESKGIDIEKWMGRLKGSVDQNSSAMVRSWSTLGTAFSDVGKTIIGALQGGGNVLESVGASVGEALGKNLADNFGGFLSKHLGNTLGGAVSAMLPGLGSLIGPLLGKLAGMFGISKEIKSARAAVDELEASLAKSLTAQERAEAGGVKWKMTVIAVRDAYLATGGTAAQAEAIVRQLWDTDHPERSRAAIEEINRVLGQHRDELAAAAEQGTIDWKALQADAEKYGIDLAALGPNFASARLNEQFDSIWGAFQRLTGAGADVGGVLVGMKDELIAMAQEAVRTGTKVPAQFRPLLENLATSTVLTNDERLALAALAKEQFAEPIVDQIDDVDQHLEDVGASIDDIVGGIGTFGSAASDSFRKALDSAREFVDGMRDLSAGGGFNFSFAGASGFARGTFATTGMEFPDFGSGTPAILHGRESVVPEADKAATARRWLGQAGNAPPVTVAPPNVYIVNDFTGSRQITADEFQQIQNRFNSGQLRVPIRAITHRAL